MKRTAVVVLAALFAVAGTAGIAWKSKSDQGGEGNDIEVADFGPKQPLGLVTSLPIYWGEGGPDFAAVLSGEGEQHWVRAALEQRYDLVPLDTLSTQEGTPSAALSEIEYLMIAQPRALIAADNAALDQWVREGGSLLLVLDPLLTEHTHLPVGDPRRPNAVALIPPLLARWGLEMEFDPATEAAPRTAEMSGSEIPLHAYGEFALTVPSVSGDECNLLLDDVIARCTIGKGRALVMADAALLDAERDNGTAALDTLLGLALGR